MSHSFGPGMQLVSMLGSVILALTVIMIRLKAAKKPATVKKILIPPIAMSTGYMMFLYPPTRIPLEWALFSFLTGAVLFSYPLIRTSRFYVSKGYIYLERSKAFVYILLTLLAIRLILHGYIEQYITLEQTGAVFFILAFGMLLPWRIAMYVQFRKLSRMIPGGPKPRRLSGGGA